MTSHSQGDLYRQLSQLRDSKKEENEAQNQPGDAQEQQDHEAIVEAKQSKMNNGRYGKVVKVQGGRIVRSTGKDRHSKVLTNNGDVRDRRFRLSAETAIEFYDIQDRLGYKRPSMAIDWLILKAKAAVEALGNSSTVQQPHHQGGHVEPETVEIPQHFDESIMNNVSKEPVLDFPAEALNCATNLSEADFMEMAISHSLMAYNYYAGGAGGYNAGDGGECSSFNSSYVSWN